jgi:hypothetical protein
MQGMQGSTGTSRGYDASGAPHDTPEAGGVSSRVRHTRGADDLRQTTPGPYVQDGSLYLATGSGANVLLRPTHGLSLHQLSSVSPDGELVVYVRDGENDELVVASTTDGRLRSLIEEVPHPEPQKNLVGFVSPQFSNDGGSVFFLTEGWATSHAVHVIDIDTLAERFVIDANCLLVIRTGKCAGKLLVQRHRYRSFPGGRYGAYEWCGLVDPEGREVRTISTDETNCPCDYFTSEAARRSIRAVLEMSPSCETPPASDPEN